MPKGIFITSTGSQIGGSYPILIGEDSITDVTGIGDNEGLDINKWYQKGAIIHGKGAGKREGINYLADACNTPGNWPHLSIADAPGNLEAATKAAARTTPSRPKVDVPVAIAELADIPLLIRDSGRSILKKLAGANIKYNFGIAPLVGDLVNLLKFRAQVDKRIEIIKKLKDKGYRKTVDIWLGSAQHVKFVTYQSNGISIGNWSTGNTIQLVRAHCRWSPTHDMKSITTEESIRDLAMRAVLGLNAELSTAWEALPWSWLVDWCSTLGDYLMAHRNIIPAQLHAVSVMRHTITTWETPTSYSSSSTGRIPMTAHLVRRDSKTRQLSSVAPIAHFPFLNGNQMGILASLSVLRRR
jgi:hypothetical protein